MYDHVMSSFSAAGCEVAVLSLISLSCHNHGPMKTMKVMKPVKPGSKVMTKGALVRTLACSGLLERLGYPCHD